ncbi:MAG: acetyl-CoA carboxylase biotin carboxyl carrier protein subunit [Candidatus Paceibacterota bacterium]|jgi:biotin carboxyl carrier protein
MKIKIKDKIYDIEISESQEGIVMIKVNDQNFVFQEKNTVKNIPIKGSNESAKIAKKEIRAPITGTISKIFTKEGEMIEPGQKILSLSAMKMENEIISEGKGKIKKINVKEGQLVKANELLAELE